MDINTILASAKATGASDIHMVVSSPPVFRINGHLEPLEDARPLTSEDMQQAFDTLTTERDKESFKKYAELDFSYTLDDVGRFRCNAARNLGTISLVIRLVPIHIPTIEDLGLPDLCFKLIQQQRGLIIISGPTGSGKSTTMAAMINYLNTIGEDIRSRRIVTIEDPIEYVYSNNNCTITQREVGSDTYSFAEPLRRVLRQDPDIILIGEMRDTETATAALTIAETGHLVLTTGHASSSTGAIERIIDLFPQTERHLVQARLSTLLIGILCQSLVPKVDGSGRTVAVEILMANSAIRNIVREGKIYQVPNTIRTGAQEGMILMDQSLINLYRAGIIGYENLLSFANSPEDVDKLFGNNHKAMDQLNIQSQNLVDSQIL